jgi:hypothetical protein
MILFVRPHLVDLCKRNNAVIKSTPSACPNIRQPNLSHTMHLPPSLRCPSLQLRQRKPSYPSPHAPPRCRRNCRLSFAPTRQRVLFAASSHSRASLSSETHAAELSQPISSALPVSVI